MIFLSRTLESYRLQRQRFFIIIFIIVVYLFICFVFFKNDINSEHNQASMHLNLLTSNAIHNKKVDQAFSKAWRMKKQIQYRVIYSVPLLCQVFSPQEDLNSVSAVSAEFVSNPLRTHS